MNQQRFSRVKIALGEQGLLRLQQSRVAVIGLGGVGGIAAESLARSGVGTLKIVDFDKVQKTDINRQIIALESTLGKYKVDVMEARLRDVNPEIAIEKSQGFFHKNTADSILQGEWDYVVDAIDAVLPKIELLDYCYRRGLAVISTMGAAFKQDYSKIRITDISMTEVCPLARVIRRRLRRRGIREGIPVLFSAEPGPVTVNPDECADATGSAQVQGRPRRILGSFGPMISVFGLLLAHHVITELIREKAQGTVKQVINEGRLDRSEHGC